MFKFFQRWWARRILKKSFICPTHIEKFDTNWAGRYGCISCYKIDSAKRKAAFEVKSNKRSQNIARAKRILGGTNDES